MNNFLKSKITKIWWILAAFIFGYWFSLSKWSVIYIFITVLLMWSFSLIMKKKIGTSIQRTLILTVALIIGFFVGRSRLLMIIESSMFGLLTWVFMMLFFAILFIEQLLYRKKLNRYDQTTVGMGYIYGGVLILFSIIALIGSWGDNSNLYQIIFSIIFVLVFSFLGFFLIYLSYKLQKECLIKPSGKEKREILIITIVFFVVLIIIFTFIAIVTKLIR